jgi:ubiquinone biosynthesis protein Coq4
LLQGDKYSAAASNVINKKGREVILFLTLLKISLLAEKIEYKTVFDELENICINVDDVIKLIKEELGKIYNSKMKDNRLIPFTDDFNSYIQEIDVNSHNKEVELKDIYNLS